MQSKLLKLSKWANIFLDTNLINLFNSWYEGFNSLILSSFIESWIKVSNFAE